jgi:muramidase (phage lysozyme)
MTKVGIPLGDIREMIKSAESGEFGGYNAVAYHPGYVADAMSRPPGPTGFPQGPGSAATGRMSHGSGGFQLEPGLYNEFAPKLGITDFSPQSQDRIADAAIMQYGIDPWKTNTKLQAAIKQYKTAQAAGYSLTPVGHDPFMHADTSVVPDTPAISEALAMPSYTMSMGSGGGGEMP